MPWPSLAAAKRVGRGAPVEVPNDARLRPPGSHRLPAHVSAVLPPPRLLGSLMGVLGWVGGVSSRVDKKERASLPLPHTNPNLLALSLASKFGER